MTKQEIDDWLIKHSIENYTINQDLTVDVNDNVDLNAKKIKTIPFQFNIVSGYFDCTGCELDTLRGVPFHVGKNFYANDNNLRSLQWSPLTIGRDMTFSNNPIVTLEGMTQEIKGKIFGFNIEITSLEGLAKNYESILLTLKNKQKIAPFESMYKGTLNQFSFSKKQIDSFVLSNKLSIELVETKPIKKMKV